jgi:hypothetical protein
VSFLWLEREKYNFLPMFVATDDDVLGADSTLDCYSSD